MRKIAAFFLMLIGYGLNIGMIITIILQWMDGAPWQNLLAFFVAFFIPMMGIMKLRERILYPPPKTARKEKPVKATPAPMVAEPLPEPPPRPVERRIANPPTVGQVQSALAPQSASMTPDLRRFVVEGENAIISAKGA